MRAVIEPTGCSVRRGAVQIRIDLFLDEKDARYKEHHIQVPVLPEGGYQGKVDDMGQPVDQKDFDKWMKSLPKVWQDTPFHSHFIQLSPDATDADVKKEVKKVLDGFGGEYEKGGDLVAYYHRNKKRHYKPFNVDAKTEALVFNALREGKTPALVGETISKHLVRSAIRVLDIVARKDEFKAVLGTKSVRFIE